jgi:hypothetical protein
VRSYINWINANPTGGSFDALCYCVVAETMLGYMAALQN